jgi:hypothetical protein
MKSSSTVFISYAREDARHAERLYMDLRVHEINTWLDSKCLLPGQNWKREISRVIRDAAYFIALISANSVNKRGFVQSEIKRALEVLAEMPAHHIFVIPVRLDSTSPSDEELQSLNWVDLFPNYEKGLSRLLSLFQCLNKLPIEMRNAHFLASARRPIEYTPYRSFAEFVADFIEKLPKSSTLADHEYSVYIRFRTTAIGLEIPSEFREQYPSEMTIVLQHQFENLRASKDSFSVVLWFSRVPKMLTIPYAALKDITIPSLGVRIENFSNEVV